MYKVLIYALSVLLLQGCIGGAYVSDKKSEINKLAVSKTKGYYTDLQENSLSRKSDILIAWGKPEKETENTVVYRLKERRYKGIIPALILPIPLYLPIGKEELTLSFNKEELVRIESRHSTIVGWYCGFIPNQNAHLEFKFGCDLFDEL